MLLWNRACGGTAGAGGRTENRLQPTKMGDSAAGGREAGPSVRYLLGTDS